MLITDEEKVQRALGTLPRFHINFFGYFGGFIDSVSVSASNLWTAVYIAFHTTKHRPDVHKRLQHQFQNRGVQFAFSIFDDDARIAALPLKFFLDKNGNLIGARSQYKYELIIRNIQHYSKYYDKIQQFLHPPFDISKFTLNDLKDTDNED